MLREEEEEEGEEDGDLIEVSASPVIVDGGPVNNVPEVNISHAETPSDEDSDWFGLGGGEEE